MLPLYDSHAQRKATNLTTNSNLSATLEQNLAAILKQKQRDRWVKENREAICIYNAHVEKYGIFGDGLRSF